MRRRAPPGVGVKAAQREPWLSKRELAIELSCSTRTMERLRMPAMRVGGQNRYRLSEVEAFLSDKSRPTRLVQFPERPRDYAA